MSGRYGSEYSDVGMKQKPETFSRFTVLTWRRESSSSQRSAGFVSIVYRVGSNLPAASMFGEMGGEFLLCHGECDDSC